MSQPIVTKYLEMAHRVFDARTRFDVSSYMYNFRSLPEIMALYTFLMQLHNETQVRKFLYQI